MNLDLCAEQKIVINLIANKKNNKKIIKQNNFQVYDTKVIKIES